MSRKLFPEETYASGNNSEYSTGVLNIQNEYTMKRISCFAYSVSLRNLEDEGVTSFKRSRRSTEHT